MNHSYDPVPRTATINEDAEWHRVNSYVADALKDCYVLFAKLARLQGDFAGSELAKLDEISSGIRDIGQQLAAFSKSFNEGEYSMSKKEQFGGEGEFDAPADFEPTAEDFDFSVDPESEPEGEEPEETQGQGEEPPLEEFGQGEELEEEPEETQGQGEE